MDETIVRQVKFTCPDCGGTRLEEFMTCDGVASMVMGISENGSVKYGDSIETGDIFDIDYRCYDCGKSLNVDNIEELLELIKLGDPL